jgi:hypothetical protein
MLNILPFLVQTLVLGFLTLPRTVGSAALFLYLLIGGLVYFIRWTLWIVFAPQNFTLFEAIIVSSADVVLLALPILALIFNSRAGRGANFMDGIALGAFIGIGYGLVHVLMVGYPGDRSIITWILGSVNSRFSTFVPHPGAYSQVVWAGYTVWGGLLGWALVLVRRLKPRLQPALSWAILAIILTIVFLEIFIVFLFSAGIAVSGKTAFTLLSWFYWLDLSGRLARILVVLSYLASAAAGEYLFISLMGSLKPFLLRGEPQTPTVISDVSVSVSALRLGFAPFAEVHRFLRSRRRLATLMLEQQWLEVDDSSLFDDIKLAEEQAAAKSMRAEAALQGQAVTGEDDALDGFDGAKKFVNGLLLTLAATGLFIFLNGWLGLLITRGLGNNPIGYFYATVILAAAAYIAAYFRVEVLGSLKKIGAMGLSLLTSGTSKKDKPPSEPRAQE